MKISISDIMINKTFPKFNQTLNFVNRTIYLYPLFVGIIILYLSYHHGIGQYGMGFGFVLSSVLYYFLKERLYLEAPNSINSNNENYKLFVILNIIFFVSFLLSLILLHSIIYNRPILYFILVTISFSSIFIEIFQMKSNIYNYILILKIILVSLSLRIGRYFNYPSIPGSDTIAHLNFAEMIIQSGFVPSYSIAEKYSYACLFHIFEAINSIVLNTNLKDTLFYSVVSFSVIIISLLLYSIVNKIYDNKTALVAVLFVNVADMVFVQTVTNINTGTLVYYFFLIILFCIIQEKNKLIYSSILVVMLLCVTLTHQLTAFCVLLILSVFLIGVKIYKSYYIGMLKRDPDQENHAANISSNTLAYFYILTIFYWSQIGPSGGGITFFDNIIYRLNSTIMSMVHEYATTASAPTTQYEQLFSSFDFISNILYNLGYNFLLMLAILGILIIIGHECKSMAIFSYVSASLFLFGLIYAGTYLGLGYLLIPHRFLPSLQLFFVIFASFSTTKIYIISSGKWIKAGLTITIILLIFFMITTPYTNRPDSIYAKNMVYRDQFTYSELKPLVWSNNFLENQKLFVDPILISVPLSSVESLNISNTHFAPFYPESLNNSKSILLRQDIVRNPYLLISNTFGTIHKRNYQESYSKISHEYNLVYSNNYAEIYQNYSR